MSKVVSTYFYFRSVFEVRNVCIAVILEYVSLTLYYSWEALLEHNKENSKNTCVLHPTLLAKLAKIRVEFRI